MEDRIKDPPSSIDWAVGIAQFRFGVIAPVVQKRFPDASAAAYFRRVTEQPFTLPGGKQVKYLPRTPERWLSSYKAGGFDALMPQGRSDKGVSRILSDEAIAEIYSLKEKFPRLNSTQGHSRLVEQGLVPATCSVDTVQRFVKANDLKEGRAADAKDRRAFEEDEFGKMWQADTCHFCHISDEGDRKTHKVYLMVIIDDHSRMIVGAEMFYEDNAPNFQKVLKAAVSTYGIPLKLYVDHGAPYENTQLSLICGQLGTVLIHAPVRDGASKAKIERNFRAMNEQLLYGLDLDKVRSLAHFNEILRDYVRQYNTRMHSGIKCAPFERYRATCGAVRKPQSAEWLDDCFLNRVTRKVRKDATLSIEGKSFDAPMQFIGQKVEVRFLPGDMSSAAIFYEGKKYPVRITDKNANCKAKRNAPVAIDYSRIGRNSNDSF